MNYYREKYYEYLKEKDFLVWYLKYWEDKNLETTIKDDLRQKIAVIQLKIEFADDMATKQGLREFKFKNELKASDTGGCGFIMTKRPMEFYFTPIELNLLPLNSYNDNPEHFKNYKVTNV